MIVWWFLFVPSSRAQLAGRAVVLVALAAGLVTILALVAPSGAFDLCREAAFQLDGAIVQVSSGTGNLAYRFRIAHDLLALLHGDPLKWMYGLGFLSPTYHYFPGLPLSLVQTSDLGLVDGIMLFGLVGVVLTYLVALIPMRQLVSETRSPHLPVATGWLSFAFMVWLTHVLLASYSLQTLWEQSGQVLVAMVAGLALQLSQRLDPASQVVPSHRARQLGKLESAVPTCASPNVPIHHEGTWAQRSARVWEVPAFLDFRHTVRNAKRWPSPRPHERRMIYLQPRALRPEQRRHSFADAVCYRGAQRRVSRRQTSALLEWAGRCAQDVGQRKDRTHGRPARAAYRHQPKLGIAGAITRGLSEEIVSPIVASAVLEIRNSRKAATRGRVYVMRDQARCVRDRGRNLRNRSGLRSRRRRYLATVSSSERRVEIGSGYYPTSGYFHIDANPWLPHLEAVAQMWDLPLPDGWAVEVRAIHSLEHVVPPRLIDTLTEWRRVLARGGTAHISVPNGPAIVAPFERAAIPEKWPLMGSILGMYCNDESRDPRQLHPSDHRIRL